MIIALGIDFGLARMGIAVANTLTGIATPVGVLYGQHGQPDWQGIRKHIEQWRPQVLVVGMPQKLDGSDSAMKDTILAFVHQLEAHTQLPVHLVSEQLSSREATQRLISARQAGRKRKIRKEEIDQVAATIILETWLQEQVNGQNL